MNVDFAHSPHLTGRTRTFTVLITAYIIDADSMSANLSKLADTIAKEATESTNNSVPVPDTCKDAYAIVNDVMGASNNNLERSSKNTG